MGSRLFRRFLEVARLLGSRTTIIRACGETLSKQT